MQSYFVAERILAVLCLGPFHFFWIFLTHLARRPRSAKNEIFSKHEPKLLLTVNA